jgi:hypothetical protein
MPFSAAALVETRSIVAILLGTDGVERRCARPRRATPADARCTPSIILPCQIDRTQRTVDHSHFDGVSFAVCCLSADR